MVDATGFSYSNSFYKKFKRGLEIRKIKTHIKTEATIIYIPELNIRLPFIIKNFQAYYDERKALKIILKDKIFKKAKSFLKKFNLKNEYDNKIPLLGDGIYSNSNELIDLTLNKDLLPIFKIKEPLHNEIKSKQRLLVREIYEKNKDLFKNRFHIEALFGNIKNKFHCYVNAKTYEVANNLVYAKFLARLLVVFLFLFFTFYQYLKKIILFEKYQINIFLSNRLRELTKIINFYFYNKTKTTSLY